VSVHVESVYCPPEFGTLVSDRGTATSIELDGECDLVARPAFTEAIVRAWASGPESLVLDLSRVRFIDAVGLGVVIDLASRADAQQVHLEICPGPPAVQRVFALCHLTRGLPFVPPSRRWGESRDPVSPLTGDTGSGGAPLLERSRGSENIPRPAAF
jgi:anti-anti-sigma factor